MTSREAYDLLARSPDFSAQQVGRMLASGHRIEDLAEQMANPKERHGDIPFVTPTCPGYPSLLGQLADPPLKLFHSGLPLDRLSPHRVAVVGSRKASRYGASWAKRLGNSLARHGISVCSGLALGIDAAAHIGALEATNPGRGIPVAVLGHGFDHVYPEQNRSLRRQVEARGILLSEYAPGRTPSRWTFPERNRIIAGLCQTVVIVEAGQKSGSLHTARFANEAGRDVWVVPNRPGTPNSAGVLSLLRDGASPMFDIEEFVSELVSDLQVTYPQSAALPLLPDGLRPLLMTLAKDEVGRPSELCQSLGYSAARLAAELAELELLGLVERRLDGAWALLGWETVKQQLQLCRERPVSGPYQAAQIAS